MALSFSTGLKNAWFKLAAGEGALGTLLANSNISIMKGTRPLNADALCLVGDLLCTIDYGGTNLRFADAAGGIMTKVLADVWSGVVAQTFDATWFRLYIVGKDYLDAIVEGDREYRIDGTISASGGGGDLILPNVSLVTGNTLTIDVFQITI